MRAERIIAIAISAVFLVLTLRLGQLQLFQGGEMRRLSEDNRLRIIKVPAPRGIIFDRNGVPLVENKPYYSVSIMPDAVGTADIEAIGKFLGISIDKASLLKKAEASAFEGVKLKEGLCFGEVAYIAARLSDYPGLSIDVDLTRNYLYGEVGAHVIGYLGKLSPQQAKSPELKDVPPEAFIGQWGIERLFDDSLRGKPGERVIEVDALGRELRLITENPPSKGKDLMLTIDLGLQKEAETAFGNNAGALVAIKPDTGEILALASRPSFDPNLFSNGIKMSDWSALQTDGRFPMLNRALQSQFPPGSVFKVLTSMAALEDKAIDPSAKVSCGGGLSAGGWRFGCWRKEGHGSLAFHEALVQSCDVYFYTAGRRAGISSIAKYARDFGLGSPCGINLIKEKPGLIPDDEWKLRAKKLEWYQGDTYLTSIGQGFVLTTPLQIARMISAVANGGYMYDLTLTVPSEKPHPARKVSVSETTLALVKDALRGVVEEPGGTGHAAKSKFVTVGGKTGTAQVRSAKAGAATGKFGDHAWFAAFAPVDRPRVAMAVFVEHGGHGGSAAAPIAKRAIEAYFVKNENQ